MWARADSSIPASHGYDDEILLTEIHPHPVVAYASEPLRATVYRMAETGYTRLPVVEQSHPDRLLGMISLSDLLKARRRHLEEEQHRDRPLQIEFLFRRPSRKKVKTI
jgi:CBS domain-containing protein